MIREMEAKDLDKAVSIWYLASVQAHGFVSETYWASQKQDMRYRYLPHCESWVYEEKGEILGFISYKDTCMPAIFVAPEAQSKGIGSQLLNLLQQRYPRLNLTVYAENEKTHEFYIRHGFIDLKKSLCEHTGQPQYAMCWESDAGN